MRGPLVSGMVPAAGGAVDGMKCPSCGENLQCGCKTCRARLGNQPDMMELRGGNMEACPHCGFMQTSEAWLDTEVEQAKAAGCWPSTEEKP